MELLHSIMRLVKQRIIGTFDYSPSCNLADKNASYDFH